MAAVILKQLTKVYANGFEAVKGIDLEVKDGEFMVLVGPSGCAKSTTLRMIAGLESITAGQIYIGEQLVNDLAPKDRGLAMVFQNYALYPHLTVYENLAFSLKLAKTPATTIDQLVKSTAAKLEMSEHLYKKPKELSGGQRQRVALGRAIIRKPQLFLFDEPLSNLDAKLRVSMRVRLHQLQRELKSEGLAATMIYVTHDQVEAMTLGDRICILNQGQIMQVATPLTIYNSPGNKFVAGFIGSPAMNFMLVNLRSDGEQIKMELGLGHAICLPITLAAKLRPHLGRQLWFGVRPEHVLLEANTSNIPAQIDLIENMGNELYIHMQCLGNALIARLAGDKPTSMPLTPGTNLQLSFDLERCHWFDYTSEINLTL